MNPADDDLDALLASLLAPAPEPVPFDKPAPLVGQSLPRLPAEDVKLFFDFRSWLEDGAPGGTWRPSLIDSPTPETEEPLEPEILLELAASQAWRDGDLEAFDKALARLPADRAEHHRRMARVCDLIKTKQQAGAALAPTPGGRS